MANQEHLDTLKQGVEVWNTWRRENPYIVEPDLIGANFSNANLGIHAASGINLSHANLSSANLSCVDLVHADLMDADLSGADLSNANMMDAHLFGANFSGANLRSANLMRADLGEARLIGADLSGANLWDANFSGAHLRGADLSQTTMLWTILGNVDLRVVKGLETVWHDGPSHLSINTLYYSRGDIPEAFVRGTGAPDSFIEYMRSLATRPIEYYTCFISYSSKDEAFAKRLYADLKSYSVPCWFAPEDMKIGDRIRDRIDQSIRLYDKLLLVLSEHSVMSEWVEDEVEAAMEKERLAREGGEERVVLFPVRLDEAIKTTTKAWAAKLRRQRHIADFSSWKNHDDYQKAFTRLLRDLKAEAQKMES